MQNIFFTKNFPFISPYFMNFVTEISAQQAKAINEFLVAYVLYILQQVVPIIAHGLWLWKGQKKYYNHFK